jgi:membrane-associated phospholipid phosphatase
MFRNRKGWKIASLVATVFICASTVFIKQHSVIDVAAALLLEFALYLLVFKINWAQIIPPELKSRVRKWELQENLNVE